GNLEGARMLRLASIDETDLGGGATHVEGEYFFKPALARKRGGEHGAAGGAPLHQAGPEIWPPPPRPSGPPGRPPPEPGIKTRAPSAVEQARPDSGSSPAARRRWRRRSTSARIRGFRARPRWRG